MLVEAKLRPGAFSPADQALLGEVEAKVGVLREGGERRGLFCSSQRAHPQVEGGCVCLVGGWGGGVGALGAAGRGGGQGGAGCGRGGRGGGGIRGAAEHGGRVVRVGGGAVSCCWLRPKGV